jgi:hypothetical protein
MNWIEYAIARTAAQLLSQAALTEVDEWTLHACASVMELLESRELNRETSRRATAR